MRKLLFPVIVFFVFLKHISLGMKNSSQSSEDQFRPLVLSFFDGSFSFPDKYTGLTSLANERQISLCPTKRKEIKDFDKYCLTIDENHDSYCDEPVEPFIKAYENQKLLCAKDSSLYISIYRACFQNDGITTWMVRYHNGENIIIKDIWMYEICFNNVEGETVYTRRSIPSVELLQNKLLQYDQQVTFPFNANPFALPNNNFEVLNNFLSKDRSYKLEDNMYKIKPLMLFSPDIMAFAEWKKPVYHLANVKPAWDIVLKAWNDINGYWLNRAIAKNKTYEEVHGSHGELKINNEIVFIDEDKKIKMPAYIWKIVYDNTDILENEPSGIAVILHNVPNVKYLPQVSKLCEKSQCKIQNPFIYCCDIHILTEYYTKLPKRVRMMKNLDFDE